MDKGILKNKLGNHEVPFDSYRIKKRLLDELDGKGSKSKLINGHKLGFLTFGVLIISSGILIFATRIIEPVAQDTDVQIMTERAEINSDEIEYDEKIPINGTTEDIQTDDLESFKTQSRLKESDSSASIQGSDGDGETEHKQDLIPRDKTPTSDEPNTSTSVSGQPKLKLSERSGNSSIESAENVIENVSESTEDGETSLEVKDILKVKKLMTPSIIFCKSNLPKEFRVPIIVAPHREPRFNVGLVLQRISRGSEYGVNYGSNIHEGIIAKETDYIPKEHYKAGLLFQKRIGQKFILEQSVVFGFEISNYSYTSSEITTRTQIIQSPQSRIIRRTEITNSVFEKYRQNDLYISYMPKVIRKWRLPSRPDWKVVLGAGPVILFDIQDSFYTLDQDWNLVSQREDNRVTFGYELAARMERDLTNRFMLYGGAVYSDRGSRKHKIRANYILPLGLELGLIKKIY